MDNISKDELKKLVAIQTVGCISVSLYMPTFRPGRADVQQNPVRLKKLLRQVREQLEQIGLRRPEADAYLQPAENLPNDSSFWLDMSDALVIFLSKDYFRYYRLPVPFNELVMVANRFHVKPLLPLLAADGRFFVLALSQNAVRLLQCTHFSFEELDISGKIPQSMAEALRFDDVDREAQYHAHMEAPGAGAGMITGHHGPEVEEPKENLLRFFFQVDKGLQREFLHDETAPLVVICVSYLFPIYKKANSYKYLLDKEVEASPDRLSPTELHRLGASVVEEYFKEKQAQAVRLYHEVAGFGRTTDILENIVAETYRGKVNILFVAGNQQKWGNYDEFTDKVEVHSERETCDVDLLDFAALQTLAHRGEVYAVPDDKVPGKTPAAAVLRY